MKNLITVPYINVSSFHNTSYYLRRADAELDFWMCFLEKNDPNSKNIEIIKQARDQIVELKRTIRKTDHKDESCEKQGLR